MNLPAPAIASRGWILLAVCAFLAACGGPDVDPSASLDELATREREVLFVGPDELRAWMEAGHEDDVVFVDNRSAFEFEELRIEGARLIPTDRMEASVRTLPTNKWAVFYCT